MIPDVSGFYIKPIGGIPASDIAAGVIPDVSGFYIKPIGGIPASDLAAGVIPTVPDVSGFYTKPANGIPASDIAAGVIPTVPVTDVQFNGTTILINGVANIPFAGVNRIGLVRTDSTYGIYAEEGLLKIASANLTRIKAGVNDFYPITAAHQHESTFYALAKAAGVDMSGSGNEVGQYTEAGKNAIQKMLGFGDIIGPYESDTTADRDYDEGQTFVMNGKRYVATELILSGTTITPGSNCDPLPLNGDYVKRSEAAMFGTVQDVRINGTTVLEDGVANIPLAGNTPGVMKISSDTYGVHLINGTLAIRPANETELKAGNNTYKPISSELQHVSAYYALAKLAGFDLANYQVTVGAYPDSARQAIQKLFGFEDILGYYQWSSVAAKAYNAGDTFIMFGKRCRATTSIAKDATITIGSNCELDPLDSRYVRKTDIASVSSSGVVKISTNYGTFMDGSIIGISKATSANLKAGTQQCKPIVPYNQHESVYYALAKLAGADMDSVSGETVGVYPQAQKIAIQNMLGIEADIPLIEEVSGASPSITGMPNVRYICGTVSTLTITPPVSGSIVVRFTSGSTATLLTLPNTVKFPAWFDAEALEADTVYEIIITDGVYGGVMSWAA